MNFSDRQVIQRSHQWLQNGHDVFLLSVLATWGSSPRPAGSIAAVRDDGQIVGSVSGGCVEEMLLERLVIKPIITDFPHETTFGMEQDERQRLDLPCGGTMTVFIERLDTPGALQPLVDAIAQRSAIQRRVDRSTGAVDWSNETQRERLFVCDDVVVAKTFVSSWRLLLIGAGPPTWENTWTCGPMNQLPSLRLGSASTALPSFDSRRNWG